MYRLHQTLSESSCSVLNVPQSLVLEIWALFNYTGHWMFSYFHFYVFFLHQYWMQKPKLTSRSWLPQVWTAIQKYRSFSIPFNEQFSHHTVTVSDNRVLYWVAEVLCPDMWSGAETRNTDRSIQRYRLRYTSVMELTVSIIKGFACFGAQMDSADNQCASLIH